MEVGVNNTKTMKIRLLVIGALNSALAAILIIARGFSDPLA